MSWSRPTGTDPPVEPQDPVEPLDPEGFDPEGFDAEHLDAEQFDNLVGDALDSVPPELMALLDNVVFLVEWEPPADDPELLGLYEGTPLTERGDAWAGSLPDRITLFRGPLTRMCTSRAQLLEEIAVTVVHEIAHHFGIGEARLHALGWG